MVIGSLIKKKTGQVLVMVQLCWQSFL